MSRRHLPLTRGECEYGMRPCPFLTCRYHLYLDIEEKGGNVVVRKPKELKRLLAGRPSALDISCALDVAQDCGELTHDRMADLMGFGSRQRVQQIASEAIQKLQVRKDELFESEPLNEVSPGEDYELPSGYKERLYLSDEGITDDYEY